MISYDKTKRLIDFLLSFFLLIVLSPLFFIIAIVVYLQDGGGPIFMQKRIGQSGKEFLFLKFRSMPLSTPNVESKDTNKIVITPFGKFIRRTNLDELPQFYNVLKGDMSFIGPRPPIPTQIDLIQMRKINGSLDLKPGLTGWAQVNSYDGMTSNEKAKFDGEYFKKKSFLFDCLILIKTVKYFTKRPPTY